MNAIFLMKIFLKIQLLFGVVFLGCSFLSSAVEMNKITNLINIQYPAILFVWLFGSSLSLITNYQHGVTLHEHFYIKMLTFRFYISKLFIKLCVVSCPNFVTFSFPFFYPSKIIIYQPSENANAKITRYRYKNNEIYSSLK